jgi:hypothetical protein
LEYLAPTTPSIKNRHEKVQESCIDLVSCIADRGAVFDPQDVLATLLNNLKV